MWGETGEAATSERNIYREREKVRKKQKKQKEKEKEKEKGKGKGKGKKKEKEKGKGKGKEKEISKGTLVWTVFAFVNRPQDERINLTFRRVV